MNVLPVVVVSLVIFFLAYRFYGNFLSTKLLPFNSDNPTPAHEQSDGVDYVPTNRYILFGHHFSSIAGLGPIIGPAVAVIWGWVPALVWIVFGSVLFGGVHDLTTLGLSLRNEGRSIGDVAAGVINERARLLFLILTFFLISLAMGVFTYIVALLLADFYPQTVIPVLSLVVIALLMGTLRRLDILSLGPVTVLGLILLVISLVYGSSLPPLQFNVNGLIYILMGYAFVAAALPVWLLLQPRDYLNSFLLYAGLLGLYVGLIWLNPAISAPALNSGAAAPADLPPLVPILFITVACGAISGFHSLVSSGTTAKQLDSQSDGLFVAYGGMLVEGILALGVVFACVSALGGTEEWISHYSSWSAASGLGPKLNAFIQGGGNLVTSWGGYFGLSGEMANTFLTMIIVSFALTTLDSGTRLLRYNIEEFVELLAGDKQDVFGINRWTSCSIAVLGIGFFALLEINGKPAGIFIWVLFGATNQLFAALGLLVVSFYLYKRGKPTVYTLLPMLFMLVVTIGTLFYQLDRHLPEIVRSYLQDYLPLASSEEAAGSWIISLLIIMLGVLTGWLFREAAVTFYKLKKPAGASGPGGSE